VQNASPEPRVRYWWEWIAILLAIASLWPRMLLRWEHPAWGYLMYAMLVLMVIVAVRRIRRIQRVGRSHDQQP